MTYLVLAVLAAVTFAFLLWEWHAGADYPQVTAKRARGAIRRELDDIAEHRPHHVIRDADEYWTFWNGK